MNKLSMEPIPEYGDVFGIDEFTEICKRGGFTDYDGLGNYSDGIEMSNIEVCPSDITSGNIKTEWTHVVWFNR